MIGQPSWRDLVLFGKAMNKPLPNQRLQRTRSGGLRPRDDYYRVQLWSAAEIEPYVLKQRAT